MSPATVLAVNTVAQIRPGYAGDTAIDKRPVAGPVAVDATGLVGDRQVARNHGGADRAVYAYATEDADWWAAELGRDLPVGLIGENLRTSGLGVSSAQIGERWRIGTALFEVRMPRTPCANLSLRLGIPRFHVRFNATGRVGAMLGVLECGSLRAGDPVTVEFRPRHGVTVADLAVGPDAAAVRALLDSGVPLASTVQSTARRVLRREAAGPSTADTAATGTATG